MTPRILGLVVGAMLGAVPVSWIVHRIATGRDLRREGSGNPGATNAWRDGGLGVGAVGLAGDVLKGTFAVLVARRLGGDAAAAAFAAPLGHAFTPWLGFRGGKGAATALGAFLAARPLAALVALGAFGVATAATGWVSLGSIAGAIVLPIAVLAGPRDGPLTVAAAATAVLVVWRHRSNFARMLDGSEPKIVRPTVRGKGP